MLEEILERLETHSWGPHDIYSVRLALDEAIVNAIKHGNQLDENKRVRVTGKLSLRGLWIEIADEGTGFNPSDVPDCTCDENLEVPSGRGLMLMRCFMSRVEFNEQGNCVMMEKHRCDSTDAAAAAEAGRGANDVEAPEPDRSPARKQRDSTRSRRRNSGG